MFEVLRRVVTVLPLAFAVGCLGPASSAQDTSRGEYLAHVMVCGDCHTPGSLAGKPDKSRWLAGSNIGFHVPELGYFYPPNLTSDREKGLGSWTEADIVLAVRTGVRPDGRGLVPVMPWPHYAALTDEDAQALARYIKSLPPIKNAVPRPHGAGETPTAPYLTIVTPTP